MNSYSNLVLEEDNTVNSQPIKYQLLNFYTIFTGYKSIIFAIHQKMSLPKLSTMLSLTVHCLFKSLPSRVVYLGLLTMLAPQVACGMNTKLLHADMPGYKTAMAGVFYADYGQTGSPEKPLMEQYQVTDRSSFAHEGLEVGKIMLMATISAITYGIVHDLITTQINFDYFASDRTHHGPVTRRSFPWVYRSNSRIAYAFLWGTIATWWVGLPLGGIWSMTARAGSSREKLGWRDLIKPTAVFLGGMLATSLVVGYVNYKPGRYNIPERRADLYNKDASWASSYNMVAYMHNTSYTVGIWGGLAMAYYIYQKRKPVSQVVQLQPNGFTIDLIALLTKD